MAPAPARSRRVGGLSARAAERPLTEAGFGSLPARARAGAARRNGCSAGRLGSAGNGPGVLTTQLSYLRPGLSRSPASALARHGSHRIINNDHRVGLGLTRSRHKSR